jgi:hypothetical protein
LEILTQPARVLLLARALFLQESEEFVVGTDGNDIWEVDDSPRLLIEGHVGDVYTVAPHPCDPHTFATACESDEVRRSSSSHSSRSLGDRPVTSERSLSAVIVMVAQPVGSCRGRLWCGMRTSDGT